MIHKKYVLFASLIILVGFIIWLIGVSDYFTLDQLKLYRMQLQNMVQEHYVASVLVYIAIFFSAVLFLIPVTVALTIAGGFLFGVLPGAVYANIGVTIGCVIVFIIVRYAFGMWIQQRYAKELVRFNQLIQQGGAYYLLSLQLLPITPSFLINLLAGLTKVSLWTFIWTTSVGTFPGTLIYTFAGQQLNTIERVEDTFSYSMLFFLILLSLLALLPLIIKRYKNLSPL